MKELELFMDILCVTGTYFEPGQFSWNLFS
jgi:hypothetical protein